MPISNLKSLLNDRLRDSPIWSQLAQTTEDVLNSIIGLGTDELKRIRDPILYRRGDSIQTDYGLGTINTVFQQSPDGSTNDEIYVDVPNVGTVVVPISMYQDRHWLIRNANNVGFDFFSNTISNSDYARMIEYISMYWPESGSTNSFGNFLGFVKSLNIEVDQLWAPNDGQPNYTSLQVYSSSAGGTQAVWQGGDYYPTSSVQILYDVFDGSISLTEIQSLFFLLAPVHLVLYRLAGLIQAYFTFHPVVVNPLTIYENGTDQEDVVDVTQVSRGYILKANTSQMLFEPNPARNYFQFTNESTSDLWISELGPANIGSPSILVKARFSYCTPTYGSWVGSWYVIGATQGQTFAAVQR